MENNIGLILSKRAELSGSTEAYVDSKSGLRLTFSELDARCNQVANMLVSKGVLKGDRVAIMMMNSAEFFEAYFAIAKIGGVVVPLNWRLVADELEFIIKDSGSTVLLFGDEFAELAADLHGRGDKTDIECWLHSDGIDGGTSGFSDKYESLRNSSSRVEPEITAVDDDLLYIMYTSGTTGLPKGVVHTHSTTLWALITFMATADVHAGDKYLAALPMFHVGSLTPITLNVYNGTTSVVMREFDPVRAWELFQEEGITTALLVPAMLNFMIQVEGLEKYDYSSVRWIQSGASPLPVSLIQQYDDLEIDIHQIYGLTETCGPACLITGKDAIAKIGSTGRGFFHTDIRIVTEDGSDAAPDEQGEVWVRGRHIMKEYWNRPEATSETITQDGWLRTGDVATVDEDGYVYIQDRIKDMIISGGENIYSSEVETVITQYPGVAQCAVIGIPSKEWGESVHAVLVPSPGSDISVALTVADLRKFCKQHIAGYKCPASFTFVDSLPLSGAGKILKTELRKPFWENREKQVS